MRIGVPREYFIAGIQPEVEQAVRRAVVVMAGLGAQVKEISLPHTEYALPVYYLVAPAEASANLARYDGMRFGLSQREPAADGDGLDLWQVYTRTRGEGFGPEVKRRIMLGTYALSAGYFDAYYLKAQKVRTLIRQDFERAFAGCDALLAPVACGTAFRIGERTDDPLRMYLTDIYTVAVNLAGIPAIAVPVARAADGLPLGVQLLGAPLQEAVLLQLAHAVERVADPCI